MKNNIRIFVITFVLAVLALLSYFFLKGPSKVNSFMDVQLGMTKEQVTYALGIPDAFYDVKTSKMVELKRYRNQTVNLVDFPETQESLKSSIEWSYLGGINSLYWHRTNVSFTKDGGKVYNITCYTAKDNDYVSQGTCPLYGLSLMMSEGQLYEKLGKPTYEEISGETKQVTYEKIGLDIYLAKKRIYALSLSNL